MQRDVYELLTATRHDLPSRKLTPAEWDVYRLGYDYALIIALRVMQAASAVNDMWRRERRRRARQESAARRAQQGRRTVIIGRECAYWNADRGEFCRGPAHWMRVADDGRVIDLRCAQHVTRDCQRIPTASQEVDTGPGYWLAHRKTPLGPVH